MVSVSFLHNYNNSCYIDSLLVVLHSITNVKTLLKIKKDSNTNVSKELKKAIIALDVQKIRKIMKDNDNNMYDDGDDWEHDQMEPIDVLMYWSNYFNFPNNVKYRESVYGINKNKCKFLIKERIRKSAFNSDLYINSVDNVKVSFNHSMTVPSNISGYTEKEIKKEFIEAPMLMVHINRNVLSRKSHHKVIANYKKKNMELKAVIVHSGSHRGGHYTAYIKKGTTWYYYDDMKSDYKRIGSHLPSSAFHACTDLFYVKKC